MYDLNVYDVMIPRTSREDKWVDDFQKVREWFLATAELTRGGTILATDILGVWYPNEPPDQEQVWDRSAWLKFGVSVDQVLPLRKHVEDAAAEFSQDRIYLERTGEADLIWQACKKPKTIE